MKSAISVLVLAALAGAASAQNLVASGALTTSDPVFNRPTNLSGLSSTGSAVAYDVYPFQVTAAGNYGVEMQDTGVATLDTFLLVYGGTFNPLSPLSNLLNGSDNYSGSLPVLGTTAIGSATASRIATGVAGNFSSTGLSLVPGTTYYAIATAYYNPSDANGRGLGAYNIGIGGGPGAVILPQAAPEPTSLAALGVGALALLRRRRKA